MRNRLDNVMYQSLERAKTTCEDQSTLPVQLCVEIKEEIADSVGLQVRWEVREPLLEEVEK